MKFCRPFPWTNETLVALKETFKNESRVIVEWWWEPFHRPGFNALTYAARRKWTPDQVKATANGLSCAVAPKEIAKKLSAAGALDDEGRIVALSAEKSILETLHASDNLVSSFEENKNPCLPTIEKLMFCLGPELVSKWEPRLESTFEFTGVSNWLTRETPLLKRFHNLKPWDKLLVIESAVGVTNSSSNLHFNRIHGN